MKSVLFCGSLLFLIIFSNCNPKMDADLIILNAKVYTVDPSFSISEAFAVKDGKILSTGTTRDILKRYSSSTMLDLTGKIIYPGFIDAHCHFYSYGEGFREADLRGTTSFDEVLQKISDHAQTYQTSWIMGRGWDQNDWALKEFPDKTKLDELFPAIPVLLVRIDGHAALANQKALDIAGITPETRVDGGSFILKNGRLTGLIIDMAVEKVRNAIPPPTPPEIAESLLSAQKSCFAVGLTSIQDAGLDKTVIETIKSLNKEGKLKIRIYAMLNPSQENFESYMFKGIYKTDYLNIRAIKLYADGALGSRGARLKAPYTDDPANSGLWLTSPEKIKEMAILADSFGYQVNTHCIGDEANHEVLKIYSEVLKTRNDKRWRIEHAQVVSLSDIGMFGEYNIIPSVQPTHATSDMYWAEKRLGSERMAGAYAYRSLLAQNGWIPNGSDFPVENINPVYGFYAACIRKDLQLNPPEGFQMNEALSREEALRGMTIWAAKASFEEHEKGSLEAGKFADFVVFNKDLMTEPDSSIPGTQVEQTFMAGVRVYPIDPKP
jgi:predicted amidohydrolase YtcJ